MYPKIELSKKRRIAFVCSGGAAKAGAYHLGVALALQEKGFRFVGGLKDEQDPVADPQNPKKPIEIYVGSSAGSIISSYLAAGYSLEDIFDSFRGKKKENETGRVLRKLTYSKMFSLRKDMSLLRTLSELTDGVRMPALARFIQGLAKDSYESLFKWKWLKWPGLFSTSGIEKYLREEVLPTNDFHRLKADLFIVATQLNHSRKVVFGKYRYMPPAEDKTVAYRDDVGISDACAASTALPLVYAPYPIKSEQGRVVYYFDGEIRDTLSTHVALDAGADLVIASYTHQPYHFTKEVGSLHEFGMPAILLQALYLMIERKIRSAADTYDQHKLVLDAVSEFFKDNQLSEDLRKKCLDMMELKLGIRSNVDFIYIHPRAHDKQMFFGDNFNLSGGGMSEIVRSGFKSAIDVLRRHDFT